jgi:hypothetical protein
VKDLGHSQTLCSPKYRRRGSCQVEAVSCCSFGHNSVGRSWSLPRASQRCLAATLRCLLRSAQQLGGHQNSHRKDSGLNGGHRGARSHASPSADRSLPGSATDDYDDYGLDDSEANGAYDVDDDDDDPDVELPIGRGHSRCAALCAVASTPRSATIRLRVPCHAAAGDGSAQPLDGAPADCAVLGAVQP